MKKKFLLTISFIILFMSFSFGSSKTKDLSTLKILKGNGTDYLLDKRVTRAQAIAFIIRMIGEEKNIFNNIAIYSQTDFKDLNKGNWYVPYIGYAKKSGLVSGYGDNTFRPDSYVSEREFYSMLLNSLNIDHKWEKVEKVAYENNLILSKDNVNQENYLRSSVIEVIYQTLSQNPEMVINLIEKKVITIKEAKSLKMYKRDKLETKIKSINTKSKEETIVEFNEDIEEIDLSIEDLEIYNYTIDKNIVKIKHAETQSDEIYELKVEKVTDVKGFSIINLTKEFKSIKDDFIESNYFVIKKIDVISRKQINVYFTQDVSINATLPIFYNIYQDNELFIKGEFSNLEVKKRKSVDNGVSIWLENDYLEEGEKYSLEIEQDLSSKLGVNIQKDTRFTFTGKKDDIESLEIETFKVLNDEYIRIIYNHEISNNAIDTNNYSLENKTEDTVYDSAFSAEFTGIGDLKGRQVDIKFFDINKDDKFELRIDDVQDLLEKRSITNKLISFSDYNEIDDLEIEEVEAKDKGNILLYFNRPISNHNNFNDILIDEGKIDINSAYIDESTPFLATLILDNDDELLDDKNYELKINEDTISDKTGIRNSTQLIDTFRGTNDSKTYLRFSKAYFVSDDYVYVEFNRPVSKSNSKNSFRLKYLESDEDKYIDAKSVSFINPYEAVIKFDDLENFKFYDIIGENIKDYSNQYQLDKVSKYVERE